MSDYVGFGAAAAGTLDGYVAALNDGQEPSAVQAVSRLVDLAEQHGITINPPVGEEQ